MLQVEALDGAYGNAQILFNVNLSVAIGEVVALLGRNGMGKTTTVHSIFGLLPPRGGKIIINGKDFTKAQPHEIAKAGLGLVPEGRQIFPTLTTEENLIATARSGEKTAPKWTLDSVYQLFPRLKERRRNAGNQLSGGEQQMLAIGRALMTNPKLIVLDEATEGLAPLIRRDIWDCLHHLKNEGVAILVIDKNVDELTRLADRHIVIEKGNIVWQGSNDELQNTPDVKTRFLHV